MQTGRRRGAENKSKKERETKAKQMPRVITGRGAQGPRDGAAV